MNHEATMAIGETLGGTTNDPFTCAACGDDATVADSRRADPPVEFQEVARHLCTACHEWLFAPDAVTELH